MEGASAEHRERGRKGSPPTGHTLGDPSTPSDAQSGFRRSEDSGAPPPVAEERREGKGVTRDSPTHVTSLSERELKILRRKQANRESARRSKVKKKREAAALCSRLAELDAQGAALANTAQELRVRMERLRCENTQLRDVVMVLERGGGTAAAALPGAPAAGAGGEMAAATLAHTHAAAHAHLHLMGAHAHAHAHAAHAHAHAQHPHAHAHVHAHSGGVHTPPPLHDVSGMAIAHPVLGGSGVARTASAASAIVHATAVPGGVASAVTTPAAHVPSAPGMSHGTNSARASAADDTADDPLLSGLAGVDGNGGAGGSSGGSGGGGGSGQGTAPGAGPRPGLGPGDGLSGENLLTHVKLEEPEAGLPCSSVALPDASWLAELEVGDLTHAEPSVPHDALPPLEGALWGLPATSADPP